VYSVMAVCNDKGHLSSRRWTVICMICTMN
jgi:hypothetical protein